jgi:nucleoside-diphosphate-sugar epimerase
MKVLVAGASGVVGRQLVPLLRETGHEVFMLRRTAPSAGNEANVVVADALDRSALTAAVRGCAPDVVVNLLTAIPGQLNPRQFERQMARTNQLRTEGTANLITAARGARLISEGLAYAYAPEGGPVADEDRPLWTSGPKPFRPSARALLKLERLTAETGGVVLRLGHLYGPGTMFASDGSYTAQVRAGKVPIVGDGTGRFSFIHTHDAATAIIAAVDKPEVTGALNVVDDEPAEVRHWLPMLARMAGGAAPRRVPAAIARLAVGSWGVAYMNGLAGADNRRSRQRLDWRPRYGSVEQGFRAEFSGSQASPSAAG